MYGNSLPIPTQQLGGPTVSRTLSILITLQRLETIVSNANDLVKDLEQRLQPVLRPEPPQPPQAGGIEQPPCSLAGAIDTHTAIAQQVMHRLQSILERIEL